VGELNSAGQPLISVLIDTYNYGRYVEEAIESVLAQDYPQERMEVLVVDDGSEDDTAERVGKYGERVQYLRKANGGQASAFNAAIPRTRGEIVALLDGDDYWLPGKLRRVVEEFAKNRETGMVYHRLRELDERSGETRDNEFSAISGPVTASRKTLMSYFLYPTSALAFRRKCLQALLPVPEKLRIQADAHLSALVIFLAPVAAIEESLAVYRIHGRNLFHVQGCEGAKDGAKRRIETRGALIEGMRNWLMARGIDTTSRDLRDYLAQWLVAQEQDEFMIMRPGRVKLFGHLWRSAGCFAARRTWRHRAVSYANAVGALIVGYERLPLLDEWRVRMARSLRGTRVVEDVAGVAGATKPAAAERALDRTPL
jgi:glycosyltransferase involved in cell wall biosynthesis